MKADRKAHKRGKSLQPPQNTFEMEDRNNSGRPKSSNADNGPGLSTGLRRGGSTAGRLENVGNMIKRRFSLRKSKASANTDTWTFLTGRVALRNQQFVIELW